MSLNIRRYWPFSSQERNHFFRRFHSGGLCYSSFSTPTRSPHHASFCFPPPFLGCLRFVFRVSQSCAGPVSCSTNDFSMCELCTCWIDPFASSRQQQTPSKWTMTRKTKAANSRTCKRAACMSLKCCVRAGAYLAAMTACLGFVTKRRARGRPHSERHFP
jgi:hypothetical protein